MFLIRKGLQYRISILKLENWPRRPLFPRVRRRGEEGFQPKNGPTGPVTLKICTGSIQSGLRPLDGAVKLKNADNVVTYRRRRPACNTAAAAIKRHRRHRRRRRHLGQQLSLIAAAATAGGGDQRERSPSPRTLKAVVLSYTWQHGRQRRSKRVDGGGRHLPWHRQRTKGAANIAAMLHGCTAGKGSGWRPPCNTAAVAAIKGLRRCRRHGHLRRQLPLIAAAAVVPTERE